MAKRKFRTFCNKEGECFKKATELIIEIEDSANIEQEAANALCRKLEQHFKDKHPDLPRNFGKISVNQGTKHATLQEDGSIIPKPANISLGGLTNTQEYTSCNKCGKQLLIFPGKRVESHICETIEEEKKRKGKNALTERIPLEDNPSPHNPSNNNPNQPANSNGFNLTPLLITGLVLLVMGIGAWLFIRNKKKILK